MRRAFILTLGCPKNEADSDCFAGCLAGAGWKLTDDPRLADLLLLNTCAFINPAVEESLNTMEQAVEWKGERPGRRLILAGCLPGRYSDDGSGGLEDFDLVIGPADTEGLARWLGSPPRDLPPLLGGGSCRYLKISEGCSNNCAYCTIPLIRGPRRDRSPGEILRDASMLADQGAAEIGIVGQDTAAWSSGEGGISRLLSRLASEHPGVWFRLYYVHPAHFPEDFPRLLEKHSNIMPYLDLPVQHFSDGILRRMGRVYTGEYLEGLFSDLDACRPLVSVRATVIVGYPGETGEDFRLLEEFLGRHSCIRTVAAFPYWHEEGTREYGKSSPGEMPGEEVVRSRLTRTGDVAEEHYDRWGGMLEGSVIHVMADGAGLGHSRFDAPAVDGACILDRDVRPGSVVECRVTGFEGPDLYCRVLS